MMSRPDYDLVIIGSGPGGYVAAIRAAQLGARVALVEQDRLGGTCLNRGCIPTKAMVREAELAADLSSGQFAVEAIGGWRVDYAKLVARRQGVVDTLVGGIEHLLGAYGVERLAGKGSLGGSGRVKVAGAQGKAELSAGAVILATGSVPTPVPIPGAELPGVVTSDGLLALEELPASLVVLGASVVGVEFACIMAALGSRVSIVGRQSFVRDAEPQLAKRLRSLLARRGIEIVIGVAFSEIAQGADGQLEVRYTRRGEQKAQAGQVVLLSTGRSPYFEGLGLEAVGVATRGRAIAVDEHLQTNVPGVYAIGDCIGGYMLAHVASYEAEVAVDNILCGPRATDYAVVPNCIFTLPEIADVGLTEQQAQELGIAINTSRFPFAVNGRALAVGESEGQVRVVCERRADGSSGRVLGVHVMGPHASDMIAEAALAMRLGATAADIAHTIHAHPTLPEALMEAAMAHGDGAIHYQQR